MSTIKVSNIACSFENEPWETTYTRYLKTDTITFIGELRVEKNDLNDAIEKVSGDNFRVKSINDFFCSIHGTYILIVENENTITLLPCYSYPLFYLLEDINKEEKTITITNSEKLSLRNGFDSERFILRAASKHGFFIPKGMGSAVMDFLIPGMGMKIYKRTLEYDQFWILPIEKFAKRNDHNNAAIDIANDLVKEMKSYRYVPTKEPLTLQLSSGLDSALLLAAAISAGIKILPVNFHSPTFSQEYIGARNTANLFGMNLIELFRGPTIDRNIPFLYETDISSYLDQMSILLKTGSAMFILDNISLLAPYKFGYHYTIEGSSYPTQLCIQHETVYPKINRDFKGIYKLYKFQPKLNVEKRFRYSINYAIEKLVTENRLFRDEWGIEAFTPEVHPYYYEYLTPCFTGSFSGTGLVSKYFPLFRNNNDASDYFKSAIKMRGHDIINKIMFSRYFNESLQKANPLTAIQLQKIVAFINFAVFSNTKLYNYRKSGIVNQNRPGISSKILTTLLSICIDDQIVNYPKWHLFEAFKLLTGKEFFKVHRYTPFQNAAARIYCSFKYGKNNVIENFKQKYLNNKSVQEFIMKNSLSDLYVELTNSYLNDQAKKSLKIIEDLCKNSPSPSYWYKNHFLNSSLLFKATNKFN